MNATRLLKLARHLEKGKLGHEKFDFSTINGSRSDGGCGTAGCAMGEFPVVWPKDWQWNKCGSVSLNGVDGGTRGAVKFFGIRQDEAEHLFIPYYQHPNNYQHPNIYGWIMLDNSATKEQVAANIRAFVRHQRKQQTMKGKK